MATSTEPVIPLNIEEVYKENRVVDKKKTITITRDDTAKKLTEPKINCNDLITSGHKMNLYEKYNNQCAISICLYNDIT
jgi:hypothetical protein